MKFKCFDIVSMVLEDANDRFSPLFTPVAERVDILKQYCDAIDGLIDANGGEEFECEVNEDDMTVTLAFVVEDIVVDRPATDKFQQLIARSVSVTVAPVDGDHIRVSFVFPSLWETA